MPNLKNFRKSMANENNELYTPRILVDAILPYVLEKDKSVWMPFDTKNSEFYKAFTENGISCIQTHIAEGYDFFDQHYVDCDCIVSNPPFSIKLAIFERLYSIGKPFAMVMGLPTLNYQEVGDFFMDKDLQLLIVNKKVSFNGSQSSFNNSFFCYKMLPRDLMFCNLDHNNANKKYVPSAMEQDREKIAEYFRKRNGEFDMEDK